MFGLGVWVAWAAWLVGRMLPGNAPPPGKCLSKFSKCLRLNRRSQLLSAALACVAGVNSRLLLLRRR